MENYICSYAKFCCGIMLETQFKDVFERFKDEFAFYYKCQKSSDVSKCDAIISIVTDAYDGIIDSDEECIHSSHSKNIKYLLNGDSYTQKDASLYACKKIIGETIYYYIKKTETKIVVDTENRTVKISGGGLYDTLVYVYETLLSISIEHNNGVQLHGACCTYNNKGYLITGKSGGGKTTLMFNLLKKGGNFHSNDRVAVFEENGTYVAYSIPIPVNMPIKMMRSLDKWKNTDIVKNAEDGSKIRFLVKDFDRLFEGNMVIKTKVDSILVVNYSDDNPSHEFIKEGKISDYIEVLSPYDDNHPKWLPIYDYPDAQKVYEALEIMKDSVEIVRLVGNDILKALEGAF